MKPQKVEWLRQISKLESDSVRYFRIGLAVRAVCYAIGIATIITGIGLAGFAGYEAWIGLDSTAVRRYAYYTLLCGAGVFSVIVLDLLVSSPLIGKAFELGSQSYHLKKNGWNKK